MPDARVTVTNTATGIAHSTNTNKDGYFEVLDLPIGSYNVTVEHEGFSKAVTQQQKASDQPVPAIRHALKVGTTSQTVTVEAPGNRRRNREPDFGAVRYQPPDCELAFEWSGCDAGWLSCSRALRIRSDYTGATTREGIAFSVAGGRPDSITYLLDGGINSNLLDNSQVLDPNPDTVEEFRI